eukprot:gene6448-6677_t
MAAADNSNSVVAALTKSGAIQFVGGVFLGFVMRSIGSIISPQQLQMLPREELRMVLCVNQALKMGKGKIGAQCAHAAVGVLQKYKTGNDHIFRMWERFGQPKITLKVQDEHEMAELAHKALQSGLTCYIVHDAGRTQVAAGSQTVLAIGPGYKSDIDRITGHLSLL